MNLFVLSGNIEGISNREPVQISILGVYDDIGIAKRVGEVWVTNHNKDSTMREFYDISYSIKPLKLNAYPDTLHQV